MAHRKQEARFTFYDDTEPVDIRVYRTEDGDYEIRVDGQYWGTADNGAAIDDEIREIIRLYDYSFFPRY